jgi:hypothetical protein
VIVVVIQATRVRNDQFSAFSGDRAACRSDSSALDSCFHPLSQLGVYQVYACCTSREAQAALCSVTVSITFSFNNANLVISLYVFPSANRKILPDSP